MAGQFENVYVQRLNDEAEHTIGLKGADLNIGNQAKVLIAIILFLFYIQGNVAGQTAEQREIEELRSRIERLEQRGEEREEEFVIPREDTGTENHDRGLASDAVSDGASSG